MIEIIPNWHPVFVHFTVALLSLSSGLFTLGYIIKNDRITLVAQWNLWIGALITIATILAGFYAYNTIGHTEVSHRIMNVHRNWALPVAGLYLSLALWSFIKRLKSVSLLFVILCLIASLGLSITAYLGAELVYRYGAGVIGSTENSSQGYHNNKQDSHNHAH